MLKLKNMFENYELARLALTNWAYDEESLDAYLKYFRISSNAIYPFKGYGKKCFLRLAPVEEKKIQNLWGELEFLQYLQKSSYPSMHPVASQNGEILVHLDTEWGQYYASVFEGVPGKAIEDTDYSQEIMIAYGKALGRLHVLSMEYEPDCRKWSYEDALVWIRELLQTNHASEYMLQKADKVFYDEISGECHVIDFEDGMYHFYLMDVEQVLDALAGELEGEALSLARSNFLKGYQSEKDLPSDHEKYLPIMAGFRNLYSYARLTNCIAEEVEAAPEWMKNLRQKLQRKLKMLEMS